MRRPAGRSVALRARLRQQEAEAGGGFLHRRLQQLDPPAAARLHPHDTLRLVRALEVVLLSGTPLSQWQARHGFREQPFDTLMIGLKPDRASLYERIGRRCRDMVQDGLVEELRGLWQRGYSPDLPVLQDDRLCRRCDVSSKIGVGWKRRCPIWLSTPGGWPNAS